jgi:tetratricopeptide (TPR) repeat protein
MSWWRIAGIAVAFIVADASVARAQPRPAGPDTGYIGGRLQLEIDDCPLPPDKPPERLKKLPGEYFDRGTTLYNNGDYRGAIGQLVLAYCLSPYFRVLKSIGLAYDKELDFERAIGYYERYVITIPADVSSVDGVTVADEKRAMAGRIKALRKTPAQIVVTTTPPKARVTLFGDTGKTADGTSNDELILAEAGVYTMKVELDGYKTEESEITVRIGKPYAFYFPLERLKSRLRIRTSPTDARILVNGKFVGQGLYDEVLSRDAYEIIVEAPGRTSVQRTIELSDNDLEVPIELAPPKDSGRWQLVIASGLAGASLGGVGLSAGSDNELILSVGSFGAATAAVAGAYFGIPDDYELGSSSYIITSGLAGAGNGYLVAQLFTGDDELGGQMAGLGAIAGGTFAALTAERFDFSPGDAALINTGGLWGTVMGALFAASYDDGTSRGRKIGAGLMLSGLNIGVVGGVLLGRNYEISRRHAALIDLAGVAGAATAAAIQGVIDSGESDVPRERQANFAIGGVALGLAAGAYFTRNMDAKKIPKFKPTIVPLKGGDGKTTLGFGIEGEL